MLWLLLGILAVVIAVSIYFDQKRRKRMKRETKSEDTHRLKETYYIDGAGRKSSDPKYNKQL
ncbi:hypothetical protein [Halobacillus kuroshimensis]|nr:hypothetical protein [Halobacillus kuroshimensis]